MPEVEDSGPGAITHTGQTSGLPSDVLGSGEGATVSRRLTCTGRSGDTTRHSRLRDADKDLGRITSTRILLIHDGFRVTF